MVLQQPKTSKYRQTCHGRVSVCLCVSEDGCVSVFVCLCVFEGWRSIILKMAPGVLVSSVSASSCGCGLGKSIVDRILSENLLQSPRAALKLRWV